MGAGWGDGGGRGGEGGARVCPTETLLTLCAVVLTEDAVPVERCGGVGGAGGEGEGVGGGCHGDPTHSLCRCPDRRCRVFGEGRSKGRRR